MNQGPYNGGNPGRAISENSSGKLQLMSVGDGGGILYITNKIKQTTELRSIWEEEDGVVRVFGVGSFTLPLLAVLFLLPFGLPLGLFGVGDPLGSCCLNETFKLDVRLQHVGHQSHFPLCTRMVVQHLTSCDRSSAVVEHGVGRQHVEDLLENTWPTPV